MKVINQLIERLKNKEEKPKSRKKKNEQISNKSWKKRMAKIVRMKESETENLLIYGIRIPF